MSEKIVTVILTEEHTHRGILRVPGTELELRESQAERLEMNRRAIRKKIWTAKSGKKKKKKSGDTSESGRSEES